ncbi:protein TAPETUM DETERMINANT 1-like [Tasmannia lanceolata]|uniref:protein TAPETUM DETERMINANT 1-like n=1 Tax=Tasmannia lanceolata TaxID=3420 RepID=UPI00406290F2
MGALHAFFICLTIIIILVCNVGLYSGASKSFQHQVHEDNQSTTLAQKSEPVYSRNRKLMRKGVCTNRDISISQSRLSSAGIPQYIVEIVNTCMSGCAPSNIHLHCGWFASARIVNPRTFKRLSFDDCLVNEGRPLRSSQIIRFTYSNTFMYPLEFKYSRFC